MRKIANYLSELPKWTKALIITCLTLSASHFAVYDLTSISYFAPMEKAADFRFSDFYTLVANADPDIAIHNEDIVIVPVDGCTRVEIAQTIEDIDWCSPAAVGMDIGFTEPKNPDSDQLPEVLSTCDNLVLPTMVVDIDGQRLTASQSYYDDFVTPSGGFAPVNIEGIYESLTSTRMFSPGFDTEEGYLASFPLRLVELKNPETAHRLLERNNHDEYISFSNKIFDTVYPDKIIENESLIRDRIVLMGKLLDKADTHITPIGNHTPGLMVHAYTAATILDGDYVRKLSGFETSTIAFFLTLCFVWLTLLMADTPAGDLVVRCVQVAVLYLMILTGSVAYIRYRIDLDFAYPILSIGLGVGACDVYAGLFDEKGIFDGVSRIWTKFSKHKSHESNKSEKATADVVAESAGDTQPECDILGL